MDVTTPDQPTTTATPLDPAEASFDIVARQESTEAAMADLRSDLDRVKARIGLISVSWRAIAASIWRGTA